MGGIPPTGRDTLFRPVEPLSATFASTSHIGCFDRRLVALLLGGGWWLPAAARSIRAPLPPAPDPSPAESQAPESRPHCGSTSHRPASARAPP
eukprot:2719674-Prymnesium_polylepis.1